MYSESEAKVIKMYESLALDEPRYQDVHRCYGCLRYFETYPIIGEDGEQYCSVECRDNEPMEELFDDETEEDI